MRIACIVLVLINVILLWLGNRHPVTRLGFREPDILSRIGFAAVMLALGWTNAKAIGKPATWSVTFVFLVILAFIFIALVWKYLSRKKIQ